MAHLTLVRHGQANTGARDEHSYDRLSELGHQQAAWLGAYLEQTGAQYNRVYCGAMQRHKETAQSMGAERYGPIIEDPRLNEFPYFSLAQAMERQYGEPIPTTREGFAQQIGRVLGAWAKDELQDVDESFADFSGRVSAAIADIASGDGPALVVTSGGLISTVLRENLELDISAWSRMCLAIMNTSVHHWQHFMGETMLTQFNGVPHLSDPERHFAQTHL